MKQNRNTKADSGTSSKGIAKPRVSGSFCRITQAQINSIVGAKDDMKAMLGCGDDDSTWIRHIKNIEKFISDNGLSAK